jgi:hypothetical protein
VPVGAAILPLLQRSKLQRRYKALLQQHKSVATIAAAAARCVWQNTFHRSRRMWNEIHQWKEAKLGAAAGIISQRIRARLSRSSFSNQRDADAAAAVSVQARIRCALGRQAWSQRVRGMQALACAVSTKLSRRRAIAAAAGAVAGCTGRMQGEAAEVWITMCGGVLKVFASETSLAPLRVIKLEKRGGVRAWGGGWSLHVDCDGSGDVEYNNADVFHIEITRPRILSSSAAAILLTFPHPLSSPPSALSPPADCLQLLKSIVFSYMHLRLPPTFPFTFFSCSDHCRAVRQVHSMLAAANAAADSHPLPATKTVIQPASGLHSGSRSGSIIARTLAAHFLSQVASRKVLSLRRIAAVLLVRGVQSWLRAAPFRRRWHLFVLSVKRTTAMARVKNIVSGLESVAPVARSRGSTSAKSCTTHMSILQAISHSSPPPQSSSSPTTLALHQQPSSFHNVAFQLYHATVCRLRCVSTLPLTPSFSIHFSSHSVPPQTPVQEGRHAHHKCQCVSYPRRLQAAAHEAGTGCDLQQVEVTDEKPGAHRRPFLREHSMHDVNAVRWQAGVVQRCPDH